uniref:Uncharacterized protein n=1 Tax=Pygocentrus nattereri TaxID=42514 RepID=A0A3B4DG24_PYGNA
MPGLQSNSGAVSHDRAMVDTLEHFCNSSEQSYEQFLSTFTYLTAVNLKQSLSCNSSIRKTYHIDVGIVGRCRYPGFFLYVQYYAKVRDHPSFFWFPSKRLPGEVEEDLPVYTPSFCHHTLLELSSTAKDHMAHSPQTTDECQSETEEVVPFSLDDTFDYDNVVLSHKHPTQHIMSGSS